MPIRRLTTLILGILLLAAVPARAHLLWVVSQPDGKKPQAKVYFSETASPDDPELLDRVLAAKAWSVSGGQGESKPLKLAKVEDALVAELTPEQAEAPIALRHTYGVLTRGAGSFLLNYYAKCHPRVLPGTWRAVDDPNLLPLEVVPVLAGQSDVLLKVIWQGKVLAGATVTVEGPGIEKKSEGTTDAAGVFRCRLPESGMFSIRAKHTEPKEGEHEGKKYAEVRHYSTLALMYQPARLQNAATNLAPLPKGVTSFGGAVDGDWLYVYGGHYGKAHAYYREDQSGDFFRLNLREQGQWEQLAGGPRLTGLGMVAHKGKIYRVGGFTAKNAESEAQDLWSQPDFARFDPETRQWETLPALPEGRSSHDAAMLGDTLYIVGEWELRGGEATRWHDTAWSIDLSARTLQWTAIKSPPFHRRALALAGWNDMLYCIGGMQENGGPTLAVAVFDPAKGEWSEGPALGGSGMDGFGSSSIACGDKLYATTMSGSVQQLASSEGHWEYAGQLEHPRFFHRLLAWKGDRLVVVGGAHMMQGKIQPLEVLPIPAPELSTR
jgi:N-acetylneuraminic acid mutarotase